MKSLGYERIRLTNELKVKLPNGATVVGTDEQIRSICSSLGYTNLVEVAYYNSETKGLIRIDEMETSHLRNAIKKMIRNNVSIASHSGCWQHPRFQAMVKEYLERDIE